MTTPRENPTPKSNNFFIETRRLHKSFEGLNSFLAYASGELSLVEEAVSGKLMRFLPFLDFCAKCFFGHNSGSAHARRSFTGSKDGDDRLVSKNILIQKMAHWIGAQGHSKLVKNSKTPPLCDAPPRAPLTQIK